MGRRKRTVSDFRHILGNLQENQYENTAACPYALVFGPISADLLTFFGVNSEDDKMLSLLPRFAAPPIHAAPSRLGRMLGTD